MNLKIDQPLDNEPINNSSVYGALMLCYLVDSWDRISITTVTTKRP